MKQKIIGVEGMTCQHCVKIISANLKNKAGIESVGINLDKKEVKVNYDEEAIELAQISSEIAAFGFQIAEDSKIEDYF